MVPQEEEESPSASKTPRGDRPVDLITASTDANEEEALELVEILRPEAKKSLGGFIRHLAINGDLTHRLWLLRRERAPQARSGAIGASGVDRTCRKHHVPLDCPVCAVLPLATVRTLLKEYGPDRRPDLARRLALEPAGT